MPHPKTATSPGENSELRQDHLPWVSLRWPWLWGPRPSQGTNLGLGGCTPEQGRGRQALRSTLHWFSKISVCIQVVSA